MPPGCRTPRSFTRWDREGGQACAGESARPRGGGRERSKARRRACQMGGAETRAGGLVSFSADGVVCVCLGWGGGVCRCQCVCVCVCLFRLREGMLCCMNPRRSRPGRARMPRGTPRAASRARTRVAGVDAKQKSTHLIFFCEGDDMLPILGVANGPGLRAKERRGRGAI